MTTVPQIKTSAEPEVPKPKRDELTGGLVRPLDYMETMLAVEAMDTWEPSPGASRFYISNGGRCLRQTYLKMTDAPKDEGASGFDEGIGERGNAVEDRITKNLRATHGEDTVLQNVRLTKILTLKHPKTGEDHQVVVVCKTDPCVIGDNLEILKLYEIKSKAWFSDALNHWPEEEGIWKVPLFMAKIDEEKTVGVEGAASLHNAIQLAVEAMIATETGSPPKQTVLLYVDPGNLRKHLEIVFSPTDISTLGRMAEEAIREVMHYVLKGEIPPPLYAMPWECNTKTVKGKKSSYCDWRDQCDALCKERKEERRLNPIFGSVNAALEKVRKGGK